MRAFWIFALFAVAFCSAAAAASAPTAKEDTTKTNDGTKTPVDTDDKDKKATTSKPNTQDKNDEFNVPSSKLDNGDVVKSVSLTHKKEDFLSHETGKLASKKDKSTETKLLNIVFEGKKDKKSRLSGSELKHKVDTKQRKKSRAGKQLGKKKFESKSNFRVFNVETEDKLGKHHDKLHNHKHKKHLDAKKPKKHQVFKGDDDSYYVEPYSPRVKDHYREYVPKRSRSHRKRHHRDRNRSDHPRRDEDDKDDRRVYTYHHTEDIKGDMSPSDLGFDEERIDNVFGEAFRPGGFAAESMNQLNQGRKMFNGGFHRGHYHRHDDYDDY